MYIAPGWGSPAHGVHVFFRITNLSPLPIFFTSFPSNDILTIFPIQMHVDIYCPGRNIGQDYPRVMIYINFVEILSLMLHAKFQNHRLSGFGEEAF